MKQIHSLYRTLSYLPILWVAVFETFLLRVYNKLGKMPRYNLPDPKDIGFNIHYETTFWGFFLVAISILPWFLITAVYLVKYKNKLNYFEIISYLVFYLLVVFGFNFLFRDLSDWFFD